MLFLFVQNNIDSDPKKNKLRGEAKMIMDPLFLSKIKMIFVLFMEVAEFVLFLLFAYGFAIALFGFIRRKEPDSAAFPLKHSFAIIVAAHNEEKVIANIVKNLSMLDYPKELYDIFVIADNCTDDTAKIAKHYGAAAFERFDTFKRGKGYALEWMFDKIFKMDKKYDAIAIFDADNLVASNFLKEMNKHLCLGHKVVQAYLDSKNPFDSFISGSYSLTYWIFNRIYQLPRYYLGLCCGLGGTGFMVSTDILKEYGWGTTSLTEDLEFTLKLALSGNRVYWCHDVHVYDEKPITLAQSWKQRKRWMQGHCDCACRYFSKLIKTAFKNKSMLAFDAALYSIQPFIVVQGFFASIYGIIRWAAPMNIETLFSKETVLSVLIFVFSSYITFIFVIIEKKFTWKSLANFILFPLYNLTWVPIIIQGYFYRKNKTWSHTQHSRAMDINEIQTFERVS